MNKVLLYIFILSISLIVSACTGKKKQDTGTEEMQPAATTTEVDTARVTCAGCGMIHQKSQMIVYVQAGDTVYFCSEQCKENYLARQNESKEM